MNGALNVYHEVALPQVPALLYNNLLAHRGGAYLSFAADAAVYTVQAATGAPCFPPLRFSAGQVVHLAALEDPAEQSVVLVAVLSARTAVLAVNGHQINTLPGPANDAALMCAALAKVPGTEELVIAVGTADGVPLLHRCTLQGHSVPAGEATAPVQAHGGRGVAALDLEVAGGASAAVSMVSGDTGGHVVLWTGGNPVLTIPPESDADAVAGVKFVAMSNAVAVAYGGGQIKLIQRGSGAVAVTIQAHSRWINAFTYNPVRQWLASAAEDGRVSVWNIAAVKPHHVPIASGTVVGELVTGLAFLGDQQALVAAAYDVVALRFLSIPGKAH